MNAEQMLLDADLNDPVTFRTAKKAEVSEVTKAIEKLRDQGYKIDVRRATYGLVATVEEKPLAHTS